MDGKRPSGDESNGDAKRAKTDFPLDITLDDVEYINLSCLLKTAPFDAYFKKHYGKSEKQFIEKEQLEVFNVTKESVDDGRFKPKDAYSPGRDLRLVRKDGVINDFIQRLRDQSYPMAPPKIENLIVTCAPEVADDTAKTIEYQVELRGTRTEQGIYLKVKDIGQVFGLKRLAHDIQHKHTQKEEGKDYVWFTIPKGEREKNASSRDLFFTVQGFLRFCRTSTTVNCVAPHGFIYLVHLGNKHYKFGKSWSIASRMQAHQRGFKIAGYYDMRHVYSVSIDIDRMSDAEQAVKVFLQTQGWYRRTHYSDELCELEDEELGLVKAYYDTLHTSHFTEDPHTHSRAKVDRRAKVDQLLKGLSIYDQPCDYKEARIQKEEELPIITKIACIYLLETGKSPHELDGVVKRVYKFGFSKNVKDRMDKHVTRYGRDSAIDTLVLLPLAYVSQAELKLKQSLGDRYKHKDDIDPSTELLLLSEADRTTVRDVMRVVGETFFGETIVHMHTLEMQKKNAELELTVKDVELAKKDTELAKKDTELAKKNAELVILEMKNEAQARRIKELEEQVRRREKGHAP